MSPARAQNPDCSIPSGDESTNPELRLKCELRFLIINVSNVFFFNFFSSLDPDDFRVRYYLGRS